MLYDYIPEIYRQQDEAVGGLLEDFSEALREPFDDIRKEIRDLEELRDPLTVRTSFNENQSILLGPRVTQEGQLEQRGNNARVDALNQFIAPNGRFNSESIGKEITILNSDFPDNNISTPITSVVNSTTVLTADILLTDAGPLSWELRPAVEEDTSRVTLKLRSGFAPKIAPGRIINDGFSDFTVLARRQFPKLENDPLYLTVREGSDLVVAVSGNITSDSAAFTQQDLGRHISIGRSSVPENNVRFEIAEVLSATEAVVLDEDGNAPSSDPGPLNWAIYPLAEIDVAGQIEPRGTVLLEGLQGQITAADTFEITVGEFDDVNVGMFITLSGCGDPANDGTYEITAVNGTEATLDATLVTPDDGILTPPSANPSIRWEVRQSTGLGNDGLNLTVRPTSLISRLAKDFGLEIDNQENEDRQRSYVANVSRWIGIKGTPKAYEILGAISGFDVTVTKLYSITKALSESAPFTTVFDIGEAAAGRSGVDGTLSFVAPRTRFSSPTAAFFPGDEGSQLKVQNADNPGNNVLFEIETFIDANTVEIVPADQAVLPEANNGSLTWAIVKLYTDKAPLLPNYDEFDSDFMESLIDGFPPQSTDAFGVDKYCWEDDFFAEVTIQIDSVTQISPGRFEVSTSDGPAQGPSSVVGNASVVTGVGNWSVVDSASQEFFLETVPTGAGPYVFEVSSALPPATGEATLVYNCPTVLSCDYCASSTILVTLVAGSILDEEGVATEKVLERVLERLKDVVPAHVRLVPRLSQTIEATFNLSMTIDSTTINNVVVAPKDAYFDELPADILVADPNQQASEFHTSAVGQADYPYTDLVLRCTVETP